MWKSSFQGIVGAEDVDVNYGFEGVGRELRDRGEEVACCAATIQIILLA